MYRKNLLDGHAQTNEKISSPLLLGPNKHGLVTHIQVNVYIGNTLLWLNGA